MTDTEKKLKTAFINLLHDMQYHMWNIGDRSIAPYCHAACPFKDTCDDISVNVDNFICEEEILNWYLEHC